MQEVQLPYAGEAMHTVCSAATVVGARHAEACAGDDDEVMWDG